MQRFQSHKVVEAAKITSVEERHTGVHTLRSGPDILGDIKTFWFEKHAPDPGNLQSVVGGYFVRYPDGYTSWSPAAAFEDGYTPFVHDPKDGASNSDQVPGLPVAGYKPTQSAAKVALVRSFKEDEERLLRRLDELRSAPEGEIDQRWLAIGRTHIEEGFMFVNRSAFQPGRVALPGDAKGVSDGGEQR